MKLLATRRRLIAVLVIVVAVLFVARPGVNGLRKRIVNSISLALGRHVEVQWVKLRVLPRPGFDLENFVVYDDPAFSAEPMLRSWEVTANLRLRSLLRGRLEIGRLSLKEPSFNLVRNDAGRWNMASLVERAAHTPATPTSHTKPEARPVFPYIEADNGRINFRIGAEKKAYALTDADFSLWQESENQWGMRLRAVPVRTDYYLTDTGTLQLDGSWLRSESLGETPLRVSLDWQRAQLGQVTKLFYGSDKGWRGELHVTSVLSGTPASLHVNTQVSLQDFRRYDIVPPQSLRLAASCNADYSSNTHVLSQVLCVAPVGQGIVTAEGSIAAPTGPRSYDVSFTAQDIPIQSMVALARRAKKDLPQDLMATGTVDGDISARTDSNHQLVWSGKAETSDFRLRSAATDTTIDLGRIPLELVPATASAQKLAPHNMSEAAADSIAIVGPFNLTLGKNHAVAVGGSINRYSYDVAARGDAQVQQFLQLANMLGLAAPQPIADGDVRLDLHVSGAWAGFAAPKITGNAQLHSVHAETRGLNGPVVIDTATVSLTDSGIRVSKLSAEGGGTRWVGSLSFPRACALISGCPVAFNLQADTVDYGLLHDWLVPGPRKRPWYRFLSAGIQPGPSILLSLNAAGSLTATRVLVGPVSANKFSANLQIRDGKLQISNADASLLGGKHRGDWEADLSATPPSYSGEGVFEDVMLNQVAEAMHDGWMSGTGSAKYQFASHGINIKQVLDNAALRIDFDARGGELAHIRLSQGAGPLRLRRFTGRLLLRDGSFHLEQGKLDTPSGIYLVSGTASLVQKLDVIFRRVGGGGFNISGTLAAPRVTITTSAETRAALRQ